jgi:hypothetical protein
MGDGKWYERGYDGLAREEERKRRRDEEYKRAIRRLWLPPEVSTLALFISDDPFCFWEHQMKIAGDWRNWATCVRGLDGYPYCPMCKLADKIKKFWRYYAGAYKIIDRSSWTDRDGNERSDTPKLLIAKKDSLAIFRNQAKKRGGLRGCEYDVFRSGKKAASIGDSWDFSQKFTNGDLIEAVGEEKAQDLDFPELFKPLSFEALCDLAEQIEPSMVDEFGQSRGEDPEPDF